MAGRGRAILAKWHARRPPVAVAIPMTALQHRTAVIHFLLLMRELRPDDHLIVKNETAVVSAARNGIVEEFLRLPEEVEYLFMFDDDMVIPVGTVDAMTFRQLPFLSGLCTRKTYPYTPVPSIAAPVTKTGVQFGEITEEYHTLTSLVPDSGVHEVHGTGGACLCLRRDLLKALDPPWFKFEGGGEDLYFCRKVRQAGYTVAVDTHIRPGHVGEHVATYDEWLRHKDVDVAVNGEIDLTDLLRREPA